MFNWEEYRKYDKEIEEEILDPCFIQWCMGNMSKEEFENMNQLEFGLQYDLFKAGWIISQVMYQ